MKILITGAKGMLGQMLAEVLGCKYDLILTDRDNMDITDKSKVFKVINLEKPDIIIHAAAYVDVEKAESEKALANKVNVVGSRNVALSAEKIGATIISISTDYVFDGKDRKIDGTRSKPYKETDKTNPLSVYAKSKLKGEYEIIKGCSKHYILRVSWLYGEHTSRNFVRKMIDLAKQNGSLKVIDDQVGSPTYTRDVAKACQKIADKIKQNKPPKYGIYHFSGNGEASRYEFAELILKLAKINAKISGVKASEFLTKADRPAYSYLSKNKIEEALKIEVRSWQTMLRDYFKKAEKK